MTARPSFKLTERQVRDLLLITPPGRVPQITIAFPPAPPLPSGENDRENTCDGIFGTESD